MENAMNGILYKVVTPYDVTKEVLKAFRDSQDLTQQQLASLIGYRTPAGICQMETGVRAVTRNTRQAIFKLIQEYLTMLDAKKEQLQTMPLAA